MNLRKLLNIILLLLFFIFKALCQQSFVDREIDLSKTLATDIAVLGGTIACQPVRTSYGYTATGDGKQLYGFTQEGKVLWQRTTKFRLKKFISVFARDMLCAVSNDSRLCLFNSSGILLWEKKCDFVISDYPVQSFDGRIYVRGKNTIACYGIKGTQRWEINTEEQNQKLKICVLNDGSAFVLLSKLKEGKSEALRISPFGEILEDIILAGNVIQAEQTKQGIIMTFSDGSAGLLAVEKNSSVSKWTIPAGTNGISLPLKIICDNKNEEAYFIFGKENRIARVRTADGQIVDSFPSLINSHDFTHISITAQGIALCTKQNAVCLKKDGKIAWRIKFDPAKKTRYMFISDSGYMVLCNDNWSMELYQTRLNIEGESNSFYEPEIHQIEFREQKDVLPSSYDLGQFFEDQQLMDIEQQFLKGGIKKEEYNLALLSMEVKEMCQQWNRNKSMGNRENLFFRDNIEYTGQLLKIISESEIYFCRNEINNMMKNTTDPFLLSLLIKCAGICSWDPDGIFLDTIEQLMSTKKIRPDNITMLNEIAATTLKICTFMGRPQFFQKGKTILTYMLYPQFPKEIRDKAVETLKQIKEQKL